MRDEAGLTCRKCVGGTYTGSSPFGWMNVKSAKPFWKKCPSYRGLRQ